MLLHHLILLCGLGASSALASQASDAEAATAAPVRPSVVRFVIDPAASEVGFDGTSTLHDFTGRTREVEGELLADPGAPTVFASGRVACRAATLKTDNDGRDEKMREHLDVANHPEIVFALARAEGAQPGANQVDVVGSFAIHGVQREYRMTLSSESTAAGGLRVKGSLPMKLTDHGIVPPSVAVIQVGDEVKVWFDLTLTRVAEEEVAARAYALDVTERIEPAAGEPIETRSSEVFFAAEGGALWERARSGAWLVEGRGGARAAVQLATGAVVVRPATADESFAEARDAMARLREKLDKLEGAKREKAERAVADKLAQLGATLAHAPAQAPLAVAKSTDGEAWSLGDQVWLELHGRRGPGRIAPLLACVEGVPAAVRDGLATLDYVPERLVVRSATMGGVRTLDVTVGEAREGRVPTRAFALVEGGAR